MPKRDKISLKIDGKLYDIGENETVLEFCQKNKIPLPALCHHQDFVKSEALCRICLVKAKLPQEENFKIVPSCSLAVQDKLEIVTNDKDLLRLRKTILELLFVEHAGLCASCYRNLNCELQSLALQYSIDQFRFVPKAVSMDSEEALERLRDRLKRKVVDIANPSIARDSSKCIECRRCIKACDEIQGIKALNTQKRGINMGIGTEHYLPLECTYCGQCSLHCPTGAIIEKTEMVDVVKALKNPQKVLIAQTAPSVRAALGEEFGFPYGTNVTGKMVSALRECGFQTVFDVNTAADFTIIEEANEFIERMKENGKGRNRLPLFTSCCPAWVLFVEQNYPAMIPHLSTVRSPEMIGASLIKNYYAPKAKINPNDIVLVSVMPCTAKKYEASRKEYQKNGKRELDFVLTTRELAHIIKNLKIPFADLKESDFDPAFGISTGAAAIFGASGGVMEAALRTAYFYLTQKTMPNLDLVSTRGIKGIKEAEVKIGKKTIRVAVVSGLRNARKIVESVIRGDCPYDFVEVMACPGGCVGGGGQPVTINDQIRKARAGALYSLDKKSTLRESHKNPIVNKVYEEFLYKPLGRKSLKFLHTNYYPFQYNFRKKQT